MKEERGRENERRKKERDRERERENERRKKDRDRERERENERRKKERDKKEYSLFNIVMLGVTALIKTIGPNLLLLIFSNSVVADILQTFHC